MRWLTITMIAFVASFWSGTVFAQTCEEVGGLCMEGCESGYSDVGNHDCFDSTCCVPTAVVDEPTTQSTSCFGLDGICMEGCEAGYRDVGQYDCFDSTCCLEDLDRSDPVAVVAVIFEAAGRHEFYILGGLCDPNGENDGDTRNICALGANPTDSAEFLTYFSQGGVTGEAVIEGDHAEVPIRFGPTGTDTETMQLINRDGSWYLLSF